MLLRAKLRELSNIEFLSPNPLGSAAKSRQLRTPIEIRCPLLSYLQNCSGYDQSCISLASNITEPNLIHKLLTELEEIEKCLYESQLIVERTAAHMDLDTINELKRQFFKSAAHRSR